MEEGNTPWEEKEEDIPSLALLPQEILELLFSFLPGTDLTKIPILSKVFRESLGGYLEGPLKKLNIIRKLAGQDEFNFAALLMGVSEEDLSTYRTKYFSNPILALQYIPPSIPLAVLCAKFPFLLTLKEIRALFTYQSRVLPAQVQLGYINYLLDWVAAAPTSQNYSNRAQSYLSIAKETNISNNNNNRHIVFDHAYEDLLYLCLNFDEPEEISFELPIDDAINYIVLFINTVINPENTKLSSFYKENIQTILFIPKYVLIDRSAIEEIFDLISNALPLSNQPEIFTFLIEILDEIFLAKPNWILHEGEYETIQQLYEKIGAWNDQVAEFWKQYQE